MIRLRLPDTPSRLAWLEPTDMTNTNPKSQWFTVVMETLGHSRIALRMNRMRQRPASHHLLQDWATMRAVLPRARGSVVEIMEAQTFMGQRGR